MQAHRDLTQHPHAWVDTAERLDAIAASLAALVAEAAPPPLGEHE